MNAKTGARIVIIDGGYASYEVEERLLGALNARLFSVRAKETPRRLRPPLLKPTRFSCVNRQLMQTQSRPWNAVG